MIRSEQTDRSIKDDLGGYCRNMTKESEWWKGLAEELETDIESYE